MDAGFFRFLATLFLSLAQMPGLLAEPTGDQVVGRISFEADGPIRHIAEEDLRKLVTLGEGAPFSESQARHTVRQLHATDLFWDVQVETRPMGDDRLDVVIKLIRRYLLDQIRFEGDLQLSSTELRRELAFREGEAYSDGLLEDTVSRLRSLYRRQGFHHSVVRPEFRLDVASARVGVVFEISAGPRAQVSVLEFDIDGPLHPDEIREEMATRVGGDYSEAQFEADREALRRILALRGYFRPEIYLRGGDRFDPDTHSVHLDLRIVLRERTEVVFDGIELSERELAELPLYSGRMPRRQQIDETVRFLSGELKRRGHFMAEVSAEVSDREFPPRWLRFDVSPGPTYRLSGIRFEGNESVSPAVLASLLTTRKAGIIRRAFVTDETLRTDVERIRLLYQSRGFLDVEVSSRFEAAAGNLDLIFHIDEGPVHRLGTIQLEGNEAFESNELLDPTSMRPGQPFSPYLLANDRAIIMAIYERWGYRDVQLTANVSARDGQTVDVEYLVEEGPQYFVGDLLIAGNRETKRRVIRREIVAEPGGPLSYERSLQSETNLYNLAVFNRVRVKEIPTFNNPRDRSLLFSVEEAQKYSLVYGIGYSQTFGSRGPASEGLRGTFGISNHNFLGHARSLSLGVRAGRTRQTGNISYTLPRVGGRRIPTVVSLTVQNENRISIREDELRLRVRPYDAFRITASSQSEKMLSRRESFFFRYNFEQIRLTVPELLETPLQFFREEENLRLSTVSLSYLNESREEPMDPKKGFFLSGESSLSSKGLGSQSEFFKILTQGRYYFPLLPELTLASALRIGIIAPFGSDPFAEDRDNPVPISERFFAGGPTTLRGLPLDLAGPLVLREDGTPFEVGPEDKRIPVPRGGNAMIIGNLELRFPIVGFVGGALFYDVGNVFESLSQVGSSQFSNAIGFGLSLMTPIGPVRLDLAHNPSPPPVVGFSKWQFHLNIGHPF